MVNNFVNCIRLCFQSLVICLLVNSTQQQKGECGLSEYLPQPGHTAEAGKFPWMVRLVIRQSGTEESFSCSGTLISNLHVLTAAHCVHKETRLNDISNIILGTRLVSMQTVDWEKITVPSGYENVIGNDIALITLSTAIHLTEYVRPICLPLVEHIHDYVNATVVLTEWGQSNDSTKNSVLHESITTVMSCSLGKDSERVICANPSIGYHQVGNGGPMNFYDKKLNRWFILGVAGKRVASKCDQSGRPILFTNVTSQLEFLRKHSGNIPFDINQSTETTTNKPIDRTTETTTETTTQEVLCTTNEPKAFSCIGKSDGNYPNSVSCCSATFYTCSNQNTFPRSCSSGLAYRSDSNECDWAYNIAGCNTQNTFF